MDPQNHIQSGSIINSIPTCYHTIMLHRETCARVLLGFSSK